MRSSIPNLIADIAKAFEDVRLDCGITIQQARAIDDYESEEAQLAARDRDREERWQEIPEEKLRSFEDILPFLCPRGYRFYIPAYMIWMLRHLHLNDDDSQLSWSTICSFQVGRPSDEWHAGQLERFKLLCLRQKQVICRFLRCLIGEKVDMKTADKFLGDYWAAYCPEGAPE